MKTTKKIIIFLLCLVLSIIISSALNKAHAQAATPDLKKQVHKAIKEQKADLQAAKQRSAQINHADSLAKIDTVYTIGEKDLLKIIDLLSAGQQGVNSSDNYSINFRKEYTDRYNKIIIMLQPQYLKWHPAKPVPAAPVQPKPEAKQDKKQ